MFHLIRNFIRPAKGPSNRRRVRPAVEALEDRTVPTVFPVTNLNDAGDGSLRAAIDAANAANDPDTIVFAGAAVGGTVRLTSADPATTAATNAENLAGPSALVVRSPITIQGTGETIARRVATVFRLFQVTDAGNLTLQNLSLTNGRAEGGAGGGGGGGAAGMGGAIYNQGTLTILGSTLASNWAVGGANFGGGVFGGGGLGGPGDANGNGGLPNGGGNPGGFGGGGGYGAGVGGAGGDGGFGGGGGYGGGLDGGFGGFGGGGGGGGVGGFGGGYGGSYGGGGAGMGGAVFNQGGNVTLANSTITANTAQGGDAAGGQNGGGYGGGIFNLNGALTLTNVTIAGNTVQTGTGGAANTKNGTELYNASVDVGVTQTQTATVTVANSIFAHVGTTTAVFNYQDGVFPGTSTINATGPNIRFGALGSNGTDNGTAFILTDPNLGGLANNGGYTFTMLPGAGPAIDAGSNAAAAGLATDQRGPGYFRVSGAKVDIGAVEVQPAPAPIVVAPTSLQNGQVGTAYSQTITASGPPGPFTFTVTSGSLPAGLTLSSSGALAGTPTAGGTANFTVTATDPALAAGSQAYTIVVNALPTISDVPNQPAAPPGTVVGPVSFTVGDAETSADSLIVTAASSNPALVPNGSITFGGSGANRTVSVVLAAGQTGTATITLTVSDANGGTAGDSFTVTVNPPPPPPPPSPPPPVVKARAIVAALVTKKGRGRRLLFVRVSFADTGALKAEVRSPFQEPDFRDIRVTVFDSDGDGVADTVRLTARSRGVADSALLTARIRKKIFTRLITV